MACAMQGNMAVKVTWVYLMRHGRSRLPDPAVGGCVSIHGTGLDSWAADDHGSNHGQQAHFTTCQAPSMGQIVIKILR